MLTKSKPVFLALIALFGAAACATLDPATEAESVYVVSGSDREAVSMAAWRRGDGIRSASGTSAASAPANAVRYKAKMVHWPTATVKALSFTKDGGGVLHKITDETLLYVLEGSLDATVDGNSVTLGAGDVASLPEGSLRNAGAPTDATVIAWTARSLTPGATPAVVRQADVEQAVLGGGGLKLRRYEFPGNSVRAVGLAEGFKTGPASAPTDSLIYVTGGPMQFFQNGQEFTVNKGDFIREIAGAEHNWNVTSDSGFVTTSALPVGAEPIAPEEATDRPE